MRFAGSRALRFLISGGAATALHWLSMAALIKAGMPAAPATALGALLGAAGNYPLQRSVTFGHEGALARSLKLYACVCAIGWLTNSALFAALHGLGVGSVLAQLCTTAAVAGLNFTLYARWVFHEHGARCDACQ
ncbi:polysaccharide biosynthesis protein GtrA [Alcanivorax sp. N3-2A]|nr:polysaccharide biosynthesis protein GtrA [Alcanivorax sp. N3-2A]